jgi:ABC-type phosphate/phosphonate transport system substrate-binding protein
MGAVAYDPKVVSIWNGFRSWLRSHGLPFDFVLYSNYERQAEDLVAGHIGAAWNSPLAWVRTQRLARAAGRAVRPLVMRDSDRDLTTVVVTRENTPVKAASDLNGQIVAVGAIDSPQATLIPLSYLRSVAQGTGAEMKVLRHDAGVGLHGDHLGGERDAARVLMNGQADVACISDASHLIFTRDGTFPSGTVRVLAQTPPYDHCNMTVTDTGPADLTERLAALLLGMRYSDPEIRPLFDAEGLKCWRPGRDTGYAALSRAVDEASFYDSAGGIVAADYLP